LCNDAICHPKTESSASATRIRNAGTSTLGCDISAAKPSEKAGLRTIGVAGRFTFRHASIATAQAKVPQKWLRIV
jgi:hypothetical protein